MNADIQKKVLNINVFDNDQYYLHIYKDACKKNLRLNILVEVKLGW